jgi:hypothetical protein
MPACCEPRTRPDSVATVGAIGSRPPVQRALRGIERRQQLGIDGVAAIQ